HDGGSINFRGDVTLEAVAVVRTRKELNAAFQQQPQPGRIIVKRRTLLWFYLATLVWLWSVLNPAMEKNYGVKIGFDVETGVWWLRKIAGEIVFTPPPLQPSVGRAPQAGEE